VLPLPVVMWSAASASQVVERYSGQVGGRVLLLLGRWRSATPVRKEVERHSGQVGGVVLHAMEGEVLVLPLSGCSATYVQ
jgi:hypothetical protein